MKPILSTLTRSIALMAPVLALACGGSTNDGGTGGTGGTSGSGTGGAGAVGGSAGSGGGASGSGAAAGASGAGATSGAGGVAATGGAGGAGATGGASGVGASGGVGGGTGGSGAAGSGGTGGVAEPECTRDDDCALVDDCCSCVAIGPGEAAPPCDLPNCFAPTCAANGIDASPRCVAGRCVLDVTCDHATAICRAEPPDCGPGRQAIVQDGCFGACVPTTECAAVTSCAVCGSSLGCVTNQAHLSSIHCVEPASGCQSDRSCACFGTTVCVGAFSACSEAGDDGVTCGCPAC